MGIIAWIRRKWQNFRHAIWPKNESKRDRHGSQCSKSSLVHRAVINPTEEAPTWSQHVQVTIQPSPDPEPDTHTIIQMPEGKASTASKSIASISTHHGIINATSDSDEKKSGLQASGASVSHHQKEGYNRIWPTAALKRIHLEHTESTDLKFEYGNRDLLHTARTDKISNQNLEQQSEIVSHQTTNSSSNFPVKPPIPFTNNVFHEFHIEAYKTSQPRATDTMSEQKPTTNTDSERKPATDKVSVDIPTIDATATELPRIDIMSDAASLADKISEDTSTTVKLPAEISFTDAMYEQKSTTYKISEEILTTEATSKQEPTTQKMYEDKLTTDTISEHKPTTQKTSEEKSTTDYPTIYTVSEEIPKKDGIAEGMPTIDAEEKSTTDKMSQEITKTEAISEENTTANKMSEGTTEADSEQKPMATAYSEENPTTDTVSEEIPPTDVIAEKIPTVDTMPEETSTTDAISEQKPKTDTSLEPRKKLELSIPQMPKNDIYPRPAERTTELIEQEFQNSMNFCLKKHKELMNKLIDTKQPFTESQLTKYHEDNKEIVLNAFKQSITPALELKHENVQRLFEEGLKNLEKSIKSQLTVSLRKHEITIEKVTKMVKDCTHAADSEYEDLMDKFNFNDANEEEFSVYHDEIVEKVGYKFDQLLMQKGLEVNSFWKLELNQKMEENRAEYVSDKFSSQN